MTMSHPSCIYTQRYLHLFICCSALLECSFKMSFLTKELKNVINTIPKRKVLNELNLKTRYEIEKITTIKTKYGEPVVIILKTEEEKYEIFLPQLYRDVFSDNETQKRIMEKEHFLVVTEIRGNIAVINIDE